MIEHLPSPAGLTATPNKPARSGRFRLYAVMVGLFLFMLSILALIVAGGLYLYSSPVIMPGVRVVGVPVGGMAIDAATGAVEEAWNRQTITIDAGGEPVTYLAADLGFVLDVHETMQAAYAVGRRPETIEQAVTSITTGIEFQPQWHFDPAEAEIRLRELAAQVDNPAGNAGVVIRNGRAEAVPPTSGQMVDVAATLAQMEAQPARVLETGRLALIVQPVQPAFADPTLLVAQLNEHLAHPLTIHAYDPIRDEAFDWVAPPERWGNWITITAPDENPADIQWQVDPQQLRQFVETDSAAIGTGRTIDLDLAAGELLAGIPAGTYRTDIRIYHQDREHTIRPGETLSSIAFDYGIPYPWIQEANPQLGETLSAGQPIVVPSPDAMLPLPVVEHKRVVVSLSEQQMWAYEHGQVIWSWDVSTGIDSSPTAPGVFQIQTHENNAYAGNWDLWMPYFMGIYRPVPTIDFMNGFHGFPTRNGSTLLWTGDLGHQVTYGCILLSTENAISLYEWAEAGVVVEVVP